jgi:drug/metabolite transporter (DMT)-like permease
MIPSGGDTTGGRGSGWGALSVLSGAVLWGLSGTAAQALFRHHAVDPGWLVSVRLAAAGLLMLATLAAQKGWAAFTLAWSSVRRAAALALFGVAGMLVVQYAYLLAIAASNAATATLLQYLAPAMVVLWTALLGRRWPPWVHLGAVALTLAGTYLLATAGPGSSLHLAPAALIWGLLSAVALAFYSLFPGRLLSTLGAPLTVAWGFLWGAAVMAAVNPPWRVPAHLSLGDWLLVAFVVVFGTLVAFTLYLNGLRALSPVLASLLGTAEPLAAAVAGVVWLHVRLNGWQWAGGAAIAAGVLLLARRRRPDPSPPTASPAWPDAPPTDSRP